MLFATEEPGKTYTRIDARLSKIPLEIGDKVAMAWGDKDLVYYTGELVHIKDGDSHYGSIGFNIMFPSGGQTFGVVENAAHVVLLKRHAGVRKSGPSSMTITINTYKYMDIACSPEEDNEGNTFLKIFFIDGWSGVEKEFPTLDKLEYGYMTSTMFFDENEFVKLAEFLSVPIVSGTIELSASEFDPYRFNLEKKVKIIWEQ